MRKIAILGGSFNPITKGHIDIAKYVLNNSDIEEIWLSPCSSHLQKIITTHDKDRFQMCSIAIDGTTNIYVSIYEMEKKLDGSTYTLITAMKKLWKDAIDFHYIIGMDNVYNFHTWVKSEELKSLVKFIVVPRVGFEDSKDLWYQTSPHQFLNVGSGVMESSSTQVRELLKEYWNCKWEENVVIAENKLLELLDRKVYRYIQTQMLYKE